MIAVVNCSSAATWASRRMSGSGGTRPMSAEIVSVSKQNTGQSRGGTARSRARALAW